MVKNSFLNTSFMLSCEARTPQITINQSALYETASLAETVLHGEICIRIFTSNGICSRTHFLRLQEQAAIVGQEISSNTNTLHKQTPFGGYGEI